MTLSRRDIDHLFERLRSGVVPERGLDAFAVGIERKRAELHRMLKLAENDEGVFKFLRGDYGCGKTFMGRLAVLDAQAQGFATSFVVVSDNDLKFYKFDELYRKVVQELGTTACSRGALGDILDRWIFKIEDALISGGADPDSDGFDALVQERIGEELMSMTSGKAPKDMTRVLAKIFELKQRGEVAEAGALISWLSGSSNVSSKHKGLAGIKGDIGSSEAMDYLHGIVEIVKASGYKGLVIVLDEVETVLRMRSDTRGKCLNGLRQICDSAAGYGGLLWVFTGTPEFFDSKRGVGALPPLHDRIRFTQIDGFANPRQPQLELKPFDEQRLREVAIKLRELYPTERREQLYNKLDDDTVDRIVAHFTEGLKADVGAVPRQFLRELVNVMDLVVLEKDFDPRFSGQYKAITPPEPSAPEGFPADDGDYDVTF